MTLLAEAARKGDLEEVERLLATGVDPAANHNRALTEAAWSGHLEVVKRLLQEKPVLDYATVDYLDYSLGSQRHNSHPLRIAADRGHLEMLEWLLTIPGVAKCAPEVLKWAVACSTPAHRLAILKRLLQIDAVRDNLQECHSALAWAIQHGKLDAIEVLLEVDVVKNNLHLAAGAIGMKGDIALLERFLQIKDFSDSLANPGTAGNLLKGAIATGKLKLLERAFEIESVFNNVAAFDNDVLKRAMFRYNHHGFNVTIVEKLLKIDLIRKGVVAKNSNVLSVAVENDALEIVQLLIGMPEMEKDNIVAMNHKALRLAAEKGHLSIVYFLIKTYQSLDIEMPKDIVVKGYDNLEHFIAEYEKRLDSIKETLLDIFPEVILEIIDDYAQVLLDKLNRKGKKGKGHSKEEVIAALEELGLKENENQNTPFPIRLITATTSTNRSQNAFLYAMSDGTQKMFSEAQPLGPIEVKSEQERLEQARIFHIGAQAAAEPARENLQLEAIRKAFSVLFSEKNFMDVSYCFIQDDVLGALRQEQTLKSFGTHIDILANLGQLEELEFQSILSVYGPSNRELRKNVERFYQQQRKLYQDSVTDNETIQKNELVSVSSSNQSTLTATSILRQKPSIPNVDSSSTSAPKTGDPMEERREIDKKRWLDRVEKNAKNIRNQNKDKDQITDTPVVSKTNSSDVPSTTFVYRERSLKRSGSESSGFSRKRTEIPDRRFSFS